VEQTNFPSRLEQEVESSLKTNSESSFLLEVKPCDECGGERVVIVDWRENWTIKCLKCHQITYEY
jgi:ribosomal protein S27E